MKVSDAIELLTAVIPTREPLWLWSAPGCGKSSAVKQAVENIRQATGNPDYHLTVLIGSQIESVDLRGLPKVDGKKTQWHPPSFLPDSGSGVLFLDELSQSDSSVQRAMMQLCLERRVGDYMLPDGYCIVAAGNRREDKAGVGHLNAALLNRFASHIDIDVSVGDWQAWAVSAGVAPEVRAFINFKPTLLLQFDPSNNPRAFASPRSWHKLSTILPVIPPHLLHSVATGAVGEGPAAEFMAFRALFQRLPDLDQILAHPTTCAIPKEPSVTLSLIGALLEKCRQDKKLLPAMVKLSLRLPDEMGVLALRDIVALDRTIVADKTVQSWFSSARGKGLFISA